MTLAQEEQKEDQSELFCAFIRNCGPAALLTTRNSREYFLVDLLNAVFSGVFAQRLDYPLSYEEGIDEVTHMRSVYPSPNMSPRMPRGCFPQ